MSSPFHSVPGQLQPEDVSIQWLESANERYRQAHRPPMRRVFQAMQELSKERGRPLVLGSPAADKIADWFVAHTKPGSHAIGALFTGAFYFDASFWPVTIPIFYGTHRFDPLDSLQSMPDPIKQALWRKPDGRSVLLHYWCDCFDYAVGFDALRKGPGLDSRARALLVNAEGELKGAIAQLLLDRPNLKAILGLRLACEIFLKFFLVHQQKLTDEQLKKHSHRLEGLARECFKVVPLPDFEIIANGVVAYPAVADRYTGSEKTLLEVFNGAFIAQLTAATVTRHISGQDCRQSIVRA